MAKENSKLLQDIFSYPKVVQLLDQEGVNKSAQRSKVLSCLKEIKGNFNKKLVKTSLSLLDKTFVRLYDSFSFTLPPGFSFEQALESHHVVLVPNHQSHADYIALTYMFYKRFEVPIYVAAGINLNIFPIGKFFASTGAFFIRRTFGDDMIYKATIEAYMGHLMQEPGAIEFFFEGGRSRTGKLRPPRFGLFQMLLEAHSHIESDKPLMFIPVTIAHEIVPENQAHAKELHGSKKVKENGAQLLKLFSLANKKLGSIHVTMQPSIIVDKVDDVKLKTQELAFECFRSIGKGMPVTPSSLLAMVLLDEPSGALNWSSIKERAFEIIDYCLHFKIPISDSLDKANGPKSLKNALKTFINNQKVKELYRKSAKERSYIVPKDKRVEMLYFKNMILHHFIVPYFISSAWFQVVNGKISTIKHLADFLINKRRELKFEFYLPSFKETYKEATEVISYAVGREIQSLEESLELNPQELHQVALKARSFSTAFSYLFECYYIACHTLIELGDQISFTADNFLKLSKKIYNNELEHSRAVKYVESYLTPVLKNSLDFFIHHKSLKKLDKETYCVVSLDKIKELEAKFAQDLLDQVSVNVRLRSVDETLS